MPYASNQNRNPRNSRVSPAGRALIGITNGGCVLPDEFGMRDAMCAGAQKTIAEKGNVETVQYFCDFQPITIIKETP